MGMTWVMANIQGTTYFLGFKNLSDDIKWLFENTKSLDVDIVLRLEETLIRGDNGQPVPTVRFAAAKGLNSPEGGTILVSNIGFLLPLSKMSKENRESIEPVLSQAEEAVRQRDSLISLVGSMPVNMPPPGGGFGRG